MRRAALLMTFCCAASAVAAAAASPAAAASTRAEYASQVNAICVQGERDLNRHLKKITKGKDPARGLNEDDLTKRQRVKVVNRMGRLVSILLLKTTRGSGRTITKVASVPAAPGDEALVSDWVVNLKKAQRYGKRSNRLAVRFFKSFMEILLILVEDLEDDGEISKEPPTKADRRRGHRFVRIINALDKHTNRIKDAVSRSSELALQLGATKCGGETDPNDESALITERVNRIAQKQLPAARALAAGR